MDGVPVGPIVIEYLSPYEIWALLMVMSMIIWLLKLGIEIFILRWIVKKFCGPRKVEFVPVPAKRDLETENMNRELSERATIDALNENARAKAALRSALKDQGHTHEEIEEVILAIEEGR